MTNSDTIQNLFEIGHYPSTKNFAIWGIDPDFKLHVKREDPDYTHLDYEDEGYIDSIAKGRYDENTPDGSGRLSITTFYQRIPVSRQAYVEKKIIRILDKYFHNPIITKFEHNNINIKTILILLKTSFLVISTLP